MTKEGIELWNKVLLRVALDISTLFSLCLAYWLLPNIFSKEVRLFAAILITLVLEIVSLNASYLLHKKEKQKKEDK